MREGTAQAELQTVSADKRETRRSIEGYARV
ncbi:hypothetical protein P367_25030 [Comamonas thiooxydans]|nr:hypothetical protein P609_14805 [Comamonas thiooxydans]KGG91903.1 hypothetical protein P367_25030 [Comamonas thiooxydans]KGG95410.1 hypothetical protein P369_03240 [Comamonas thiooxydans]